MRSGCAFALALIAATPAALHACSCASYEPKACRLYHTAPVIVRARILDHNHQRDKLDPVTLYRFSVVEVFKGLSPDVEQILIDPSNWSSCYTEFREGVDYLLYLGGPSTFITKWTDHLDRPASASEQSTRLPRRNLRSAPKDRSAFHRSGPHVPPGSQTLHA